MKTSGLIILGLCLPVFLAQAQEERRDSLAVPSYEPSRPHFNMASQIRPTGVKISSSAYDRGVAQQKAASGESVSSPALKSAASSDAQDEEPRALEDLTLPAGVMPYYYGGWSSYSLHEGMNVSMDLSAMVQSGKHARSGVGFRQRVDATYVMPLSKHWWATAGGYLDHVSWGGDSYLSEGLYGELGYQFNEHWSASIYAQKSLYNRNVGGGYPYYGYGGYYGRHSFGLYGPWDYTGNLGDKIGAAVRWTPNRNFSIGVSVEYNKYPNGVGPYGWGY